MPAVTRVVWERNIRKQYDLEIKSRGRTRTYSFYEKHFEVWRPDSCSTFPYEDLIQIVEKRDRFYLELDKQYVIPVPKTDQALAEIFKNTGKVAEKKSLLLPMHLMLYAGAFLFSGMLLISSFKPKNDWTRDWIIDLIFLSFAFFQAAAILRSLAWKSYSIPNVHGLANRLILCILSGASWIAVGMLLLLVTMGIAFAHGSSSKNENGTYTRTWTGVHHTHYTLMEDDGPFFLKPLRPMDGPDDIDPYISSVEQHAAQESQ
jgi:hypothetical protein